MLRCGIRASGSRICSMGQVGLLKVGNPPGTMSH